MASLNLTRSPGKQRADPFSARKFRATRGPIAELKDVGGLLFRLVLVMLGVVLLLYVLAWIQPLID